jgi:hypothetical protein
MSLATAFLSLILLFCVSLQLSHSFMTGVSKNLAFDVVLYFYLSHLLNGRVRIHNIVVGHLQIGEL